MSPKYDSLRKYILSKTKQRELDGYIKELLKQLTLIAAKQRDTITAKSGVILW